jgi:AcrR family transcriptional regulator
VPVSVATSAMDGAGRIGPLPRGRHGLPRELVLANQRERMAVAATEIIAREGYAALTVTDVIARAGVSRATFYKIFEDKTDAALAAQRRAFELLDRTLTSACASSTDWPEGVRRAIAAAIEFCRSSRDESRLLLACNYAHFEPRLAGREVALPSRLVKLLDEGAARHTGRPAPTPPSAELGVCTAISIFGTCIAEERTEALPGLYPDLVDALLAPYLEGAAGGGEQSKRIAPAA